MCTSCTQHTYLGRAQPHTRSGLTWHAPSHRRARPPAAPSPRTCLSRPAPPQTLPLPRSTRHADCSRGPAGRHPPPPEHARPHTHKHGWTGCSTRLGYSVRTRTHTVSWDQVTSPALCPHPHCLLTQVSQEAVIVYILHAAHILVPRTCPTTHPLRPDMARSESPPRAPASRTKPAHLPVPPRATADPAPSAQHPPH